MASIDGDKDVTSVTLESGEQLPTDLVLIRIGSKPSIKLAEEAGLRIAENGSVWVDEDMRTSAEGVFAFGHCALKRIFFTRKGALSGLPRLPPQKREMREPISTVSVYSIKFKVRWPHFLHRLVVFH